MQGFRLKTSVIFEPKISELEFYQWLVPAVALLYCIRLLNQYLKGKRLLKGTILWFVFWAAVVTLAIVPDAVSNRLARILGFKDNINTIIFIALGFLFLFNIYFTLSIERLEKQMTELVRKQAIETQLLKEKALEAEKKEAED